MWMDGLRIGHFDLLVVVRKCCFRALKPYVSDSMVFFKIRCWEGSIFGCLLI